MQIARPVRELSKKPFVFESPAGEGMRTPYLTLVIPTRNDGYPSNVLPVQNRCLSILQYQLEQARIDSEIIIVEYNSDSSNPHLYESLRVGHGRHVTIKVITIDPHYHRRFSRWEKRVFHQTCAINAGLRRSRGRFFVYRAADHIYSDNLVRFLGRKTLLEDCIYRCDRFDIDCAALEALSPSQYDNVASVCDRHIVDWHRPLEVEPSYRIPKLHTNACGDFLLMSRDAWMKVAGLREGRYPIFLDYDSLVLYAAHSRGNVQAILPPECRVYKLNHGMKTTARITQEWSRAAKRLDEMLSATGSTAIVNWSRIIFNYPRRKDRTFPDVLLDSYERHFVLPAFLWSHGLPVVRQNLGDWGLGHEQLSENILASAEWEGKAEPLLASAAG